MFCWDFGVSRCCVMCVFLILFSVVIYSFIHCLFVRSLVRACSVRACVGSLVRAVFVLAYARSFFFVFCFAYFYPFPSLF